MYWNNRLILVLSGPLCSAAGIRTPNLLLTETLLLPKGLDYLITLRSPDEGGVGYIVSTHLSFDYAQNELAKEI